MARFPRRLSFYAAVSSFSVLSGCITPIPKVAPEPVVVVAPVVPVPVAPIRVAPIAAPVVPRNPAPVVPSPIVPTTTCNIFNTGCPTSNGGGGDGGELPPDWQ